ncbi:type II toxin-antitoxin system VapC family toxin [Roseofilum reptotaenium CS-1145]|uniref:Twitching motility protein PilT n=1 Tax=Roseofilum reptotaenium AO1-A TaxID=1925591 RepID=A0A1L9QXP2_9CYAN|nr:type II toxin-antitoxin system VapC family toxin [Roseofilum reptotaenium]MDB9515925.1 type II toxin-antitoxin system VapC family toxin [Roseofilum reptotaenium CS-1145]OJJ27406.1 twitching motility protein PilT [Roseofilum reptotaenium AO1-A]
MGISYLLDTHVLLWWFFDDQRLDSFCRNLIGHPNYDIWVSSASAWEIATKYRLGKLPEAKPIIAQYAQLLAEAQFLELHITSAHALRAGNLPIKHRDPFDRIIMAQGELENIPIITYDRAFNTGLIQIIP